MKISPTLTPFRWYNEYYDQDRFQTECTSVCEFNLITDKRRLLPFQFTRPASGYGIKKWFLRRFCDEPCKEILTPADMNFVDGSMRWIQGTEAWEFGCNNLACAIPSVGTGYLEILGLLTIGKTYQVKFTVATFKATAGLQLNIKDGATIINTVTSSGIIQFSFTAITTDFRFEFINGVFGDELCIEDVSICQDYEPLVDDFDLPISSLTLNNVGANDIIGYCGGDLNLIIPENKYYSIIIDDQDNFFYSEVIYVKNFEFSKTPYVLIEWYNSCDIQDASYSPLTFFGSVPPFSCNYLNRLYLEDGILTKPDYPFKEEVEEDGNAVDHATFQRWQKIISLLAYKVPEFIIDSLTSMKLHDTIYYFEPLRIGQYTISAPKTVKSVEYEVSYILNDCFGNVDLKLLLAEQYVDETCCNNLPYEQCFQCEYSGVDVNNLDPILGYGLLIGLPGEDDGFYLFIEGVWVLQEETPVVCDIAGKFWIFGCPCNLIICSGAYYIAPVITSLNYISGTTFAISADLIPNAYGQVEYSNNLGATWIKDPNIYTSNQLGCGVNVTLIAVPNCGDILFRVKSFSLACDYGYTGEIAILSPDQTGC